MYPYSFFYIVWPTFSIINQFADNSKLVSVTIRNVMLLYHDRDDFVITLLAVKQSQIQ